MQNTYLTSLIFAFLTTLSVTTGVFQGSCRVNRLTMPLFSRPLAPDPDSKVP